MAKKFEEMTDEEKKQSFERWISQRPSRLRLQRELSKALKKDDYYRALLKQHKQMKEELREAEDKRSNLWTTIISIRRETLIRLIKEKGGS